MLSDAGVSPILVAKSGSWDDEASTTGRAIRVTWREGTAADSNSRTRGTVLRGLEELSALRLGKLIRNASLLVTSQPGPTAFFSKTSGRYWPNAGHAALVHGTSSVEWPFHDHNQTLEGLDDLFAATPEVYKMLRLEAPEKRISQIGNLFRAEGFWGTDLPNVIQNYCPAGPIVFLGTLTPNKTAPLKSLIEALKTQGSKLQVLGAGPELPSLKDLATKLGASDRIEFIGAVSDPRPWLKSASVVVTAGRGAIESLSGGRPAIIATSEGNHGLARHADLLELESYNFTGRTPSSEANSSEAMARALASVRSLTKDERHLVAESFASVGSIDPILMALGRVQGAEK